MILRVAFDQFAQEVKTRLGISECYVSPILSGCLLTSANPGQELVIVARCAHLSDHASQMLAAQGLMVHHGEWALSAAELEAESDPLYVAAVAYRSQSGTPGLWVDASFEEVQPPDVLRRMFDEFIANGEINDVSFDDFVQAANANILILSPNQLLGFAEDHRSDC